MVYSTRGKELLNPDFIFKKLGVKSGDRVAHLGCGGAAQFIVPAAKLVGKDAVLYAVDILKPVLEATISKARLEGIYNIKTVWSDLEIPGATRIPAASLNHAFLINILYESNKQKEIITEAARLLHTGGRLLIVDWNQTPSPFGPPLENRTNQEKVEKLAREANLKIIDQFQAGPYHYGLIAEKS
jgi:ubiquinone/menaquinone biosynthesis C-methylase UbiE